MQFITLEQARRAVALCFAADHPVGLWGIPGIGKSSVIADVTESIGWKLYDYNLSDKEPTDIGGTPFPVDGAYLTYLIAKGLLPFDNDEECVLLFDEIDRANPDVLNMVQRIVLERRINGHKLSPNCRIVVAGNGVSDIYTTPLSEALRNRLCHLYIEATSQAALDSWLNWADDNGVSPVLQGFAKFKPEIFISQSAKAKQIEELALARPRSWVAVGKLVEAADALEQVNPDLKTRDIIRAVVAGCVGEAAATEFLAYKQLHESAPSIESILANPSTAAIPDRVDILYSLSVALTKQAESSREVAEKVAIYGSRWPDEPAALLKRKLVAKQPLVASTPAYQNWHSASLKQDHSDKPPVDNSMVPALVAKLNGTALPESDSWVNRVQFTSDSGNKYIISQNRASLTWGCDCAAWRTRRTCKHLDSVAGII